MIFELMSEMCEISNQEQVAYFLGVREWIQLLGLNWNETNNLYLEQRSRVCLEKT
jgi:hypothetical protein